MSDYIPLKKQKLNPYLDIPTEVWTEVFKLLPRRNLVQNVQPVNKVFKAIGDKNVKNVHIIKNATNFTNKLEKGESEAMSEFNALAGHNCPLAGQFRITDCMIYRQINETVQLVLRHCLDLFQEVAIVTGCGETVTEEDLALLTLFGQTKPIYIEYWFESNSEIEPNLDGLLRNGTVLKCPQFHVWENFHALASLPAFFDWLHHKVEVVENSSDVGQEAVRCLVLSASKVSDDHDEFVQSLIDSCVQNLQQARGPSDRRQFVFSIECYDSLLSDEVENFGRVENKSTGEVLLLERFDYEHHPATHYRLARCLASQIANGTEEFFAKLFGTEGGQLKVEDEQGNEPSVLYL